MIVVDGSGFMIAGSFGVYLAWNSIVDDRGALALHAGCEVVPVNGENTTVLIVGLAGTGKTTTRLRQERKDFPGSFPGLDEALVKSLG